MSLTPPPIVPIEIVTIDQLTQSPLKKQRNLPKAARTKKIVHTRTRKEQMPTPALKQEVKNVTKDVIEKVALKPIKTKKKPVKTEKKQESDLKPKKNNQEINEEKNKKEKNDDFTSVLRAVQELRKEQPDEGQEKAFKSDHISDKLTISELDALRQQIQKCWNIPAGARNLEDMIVEIDVIMNEDSTVEEARIKNKALMLSDSFFRTVAESARRAMYAPDCTPLKLPTGKYEEWKNFTITFNPKEVL
tara:strand:- start:42560 stop:43300 length:741 start_codon:yes stop_codon:yes gene_type:complete